MDQIRSIVIPTNFSGPSQAAIARALMLARLDGASIHLVHAVQMPHLAAAYEFPMPDELLLGIRNEAREKLEAARKTIENSGIAEVTADVSDSEDPVSTISAAVKRYGADLVVIGTRGHAGIKLALLGSITQKTLRDLECPVFVVNEEAPLADRPITRILLPVDFSIHSDFAAELAADLAVRLEASVDLLHAFELPRDYTPYGWLFGPELEEKMLSDINKRLVEIRQSLEHRQLDVTAHGRRGAAAPLIAEAAEEFESQLIVMGTRGNSGLSRAFLGSVAERTIRAAPCSVLAVKAPETQAS